MAIFKILTETSSTGLFFHYFYGMKENNYNRPETVLEKISGTAIHHKFGEPFLDAFRTMYNDRDDEVTAAAYTCSLFLSAIKSGFPTTKLHSFVHYIQENYSRLHFDCSKYDTIIGLIGEERMKRTVLADSSLNFAEVECSANDITEALDFYTNR